MTLRTSIVITAEGAQAKQVIDDLADSAERLGETTKDAAAPANDLADATDEMAARAAGAVTNVVELHRAQGTAAGSSRTLATAQGIASTAAQTATGSVAALTTGLSAATIAEAAATAGAELLATALSAALTAGISLVVAGAIGLVTWLFNVGDAAEDSAAKTDKLAEALKRVSQLQVMQERSDVLKQQLELEALQSRVSRTPDNGALGTAISVYGSVTGTGVADQRTQLEGEIAARKQALELAKMQLGTDELRLRNQQAISGSLDRNNKGTSKAVLDAQAELYAASTALDRAKAEEARISAEGKQTGETDEAYIKRLGDAKKRVDELTEAMAAARKEHQASAAAIREHNAEQQKFKATLDGLVTTTMAQLQKGTVKVDLLPGFSEASKSLTDFVAGIDRERDALRNLDPVQEAIVSQEKQLAAMTPEMRDYWTQRITMAVQGREANRAYAEATADAARAEASFARAGVDALSDVIVRGEKAGETMERLAESIAEAALQATLLGSGPLASLLGTAAPHGQVGGLLSFLVRAPEPAAPGAPMSAGSMVPGLGEAIGKAAGKEQSKVLDDAFGKSGSLGKLLQYGGLGYAAGSVTGSGFGGAAGGTLGGWAGEQLGKELVKNTSSSLLKSLGGAAGPIGSIVGGLLGGALGGLFASIPHGTATLTSATGTAAYTGSDSLKSATGSLAEQVQSGIKQIADELGGTLNSFDVMIGTWDDQFRVRTTSAGWNGQGGLNFKGDSANNLFDFGKDQGAAISFAIADAIKDGAISGLSPAVQKALTSSTNAEDALAEAQKVAALEQAIAGAGGAAAEAVKSFQKEADERLRIARQYGLDVVKVEQLNAKERLDLNKQLLDQQVGSLQQLVDEMTAGSLFEGSAVDQRTALLAQIEKSRADVDNGVDGAVDKLANLLQQLDQVSEAVYGTGAGREADRAFILDVARTEIAQANAQIQAAGGQSDPALATTNAALDENNDQNARMIAALETNNQLLQQLLAHGVDNDLAERLAQQARTS